MFGHTRTDKLKKDIRSLEDERDTIVDENRKTKDELAELKQTKKMEDENIRHLVKIKESKLDIEHQRRNLVREEEQIKAIAKVRDEYRDKQESTLNEQIRNGNAIYKELLARLPDINVKLKGKV